MATMLDERRDGARSAHDQAPTSRTAVLLHAQPIMLEIIERLLEALEIETVSTHTTPDAALGAIGRHRPDAFILDFLGCDHSLDGVSSIREARGLVPTITAVAFADIADERQVAALLAAGAAVAVSRTATLEELAGAVRQAFGSPLHLEPCDTPHSRAAREQHRSRRGSHEARAGDTPARRRGVLERSGRASPVGDGPDGQVPPHEHLPKARRRQPHRGRSLGPAARPTDRRRRGTRSRAERGRPRRPRIKPTRRRSVGTGGSRGGRPAARPAPSAMTASCHRPARVPSSYRIQGIADPSNSTSIDASP